MKLTVNTLTGEMFDLEIKEDALVKEVKRQLYKTSKLIGKVRLLQGQSEGQVVLEDEQKLSEYQLQDGAVISALFEPDVNIEIKITFGFRKCTLKVPDSTRVVEVKAKLDDLLCRAAGNFNLLYGDIQLEDDFPLHCYDITSGAYLYILRPFVNVTIENNKGSILYRRIKRTDTIFELKTKLQYSKHSGPWKGEGDVNFQLGHPEDMRIFGRVIDPSDDKLRNIELDDDKTVAHYKIKDNTHLCLIPYRWNYHPGSKVYVECYMGDEKLCEIQGVEKGDTAFSVMLRAQEQTGFDANNMTLHLADKLYMSPFLIGDDHRLRITVKDDV